MMRKVIPFTIWCIFCTFCPGETSSPQLWSPNVSCFDIYVHDEEDLFLSTSKGVVRVAPDFSMITQPERKRISLFTKEIQHGVPLSGVSYDRYSATWYADLTKETTASRTFKTDGRGHAFQTKKYGWWHLDQRGRFDQFKNGLHTTYTTKDFNTTGLYLWGKPFPFFHRSSPDGSFVIYQQTGPFIREALYDFFFIYQEGTLRTIPTESKGMGFFEYLDAKRLLIGGEEGLMLLDLKMDKIIETWKPPEDLFAKPVIPVFSKQLLDGTRIFFYAHSVTRGTRQIPFEHGGTLQIVELKEGQWKKIPHRLDPDGWSYKDEDPRPMLEDSQGNFWSVNNGKGLIKRDKKGNWTTFDSKHGIPFTHACNLIHHDDKLWVIYNHSRLVVLNPHGFRNQLKPKNEPYIALKNLLCEPVTSSSGICYFLEKIDQGEDREARLISLRADGEERIIPHPEKDSLSSFRLINTKWMALDSEERLWVFNHNHTIKTWKDGAWTSYSSTLPYWQQERLRLEIAFQSKADKGPEYRIGSPRNPFYPIFSGDGRVVFRNKYDRVSYFDGEKWYSPESGKEVPGMELTGHPFFHDGDVITSIGGEFYRMRSDTWPDNPSHAHIRKWEKFPYATPPYTIPKEKTRLKDLPATPYPDKHPVWHVAAEDDYWVGFEGMTIFFRNGRWFKVPGGTPLESSGRIHRVVKSASGHIFLQHDHEKHTYTVLFIKTVDAIQLREDLGIFDTPDVTLKPEFESEEDMTGMLQKFKLNNGSWSELLPVGTIHIEDLNEPDTHQLQVRLVSEGLYRESPILTYRFTTTYDQKKEHQQLIRNFMHEDSDIRIQAEKALIELGPDAADLIRIFLYVEESDLRRRAQRILDAVK